MMNASIAIMGGTNLYQMEDLDSLREVRIETPFGDPSDVITIGELSGVRAAFLPRHGRGHRLLPSEIPSRANIYALKSLGVESIISISSAGSLREEIKPLEILIPDQLIDRTRNRPSSFFGDGIVAHVGFAEPFCSTLSQVLYQSSLDAGARVHLGGTYVVMEGPQFSTKAESNLHRSWGASIIGMTALPEAKLAREAEICYATLGLVTDYDCWHASEEVVTVDMVINNLITNAETARKIIGLALPRISPQRDCECARALENCILTAPDSIRAEQRRKLHLLINKHVT